MVQPTNNDHEDVEPTEGQLKEEQIVSEKFINEEYKIWKKNTPFLYDILLSTALEWPTLTAQWFPDKNRHPDKNYSTHRLLLGTHTSSEVDNYLQIAHVQLPNPVNEADPGKYDDDRGEIGGYGNDGETRFEVKEKIPHDGEVNKARYMPQKPDIIATMSPSANVYIFDRTKHSTIGGASSAGPFKPEMTLKGHTQEGYGLNWNPHKEGHLLTGAEDSVICLWDIQNYSKSDNVITPTAKYEIHSAIVNDVQHHPIHHSLFGSVSDDLQLQIVDLRSNDYTRASQKVNAHSDAVNAIAFNPASEYILATASADRTVALWDLRKLKLKLHSLVGHQNDVLGLQWHPQEEAILASSSSDRRVIFWDLTRIGEEQTQEDAEDGAPELLFMHGGHTNRVSDFCWNPNDPWVMVSAAEDNLLQCWKVANAIVGTDDGDADIPSDEIDG